MALYSGMPTAAQPPEEKQAAGSHALKESTEPAPDPESEGLFEILKAGGKVGLVILLLSIAMVALIVEHFMTIRESAIMPPALGDQVREQLMQGQANNALHLCENSPSMLSSVLSAGIHEADGGWSAVEKAMEDSLGDQSARLYRKIEYLSLIGNIAPMLGLLGTVLGMIFAFKEVAATQGAARAADLAGGIYQALVTTVMGLIVAIPSLAAFAIFRNRIDQFSSETAYVAQHVFAPLRKKQHRTKTTTPPAPAAASSRPQPPAPPA